MTLSKMHACVLTSLLTFTACAADELRALPALGEIQVGELTISAPLFPRYQLLFDIEAPNYPETPAAVEEWLNEHEAVLSFEELLDYCSTIAPYSEQIRLPSEGELSPEEIRQNYHAISDCSYDQAAGFESKPYWIPQVIADVNLCGNELGEGWSMMTEDFVLAQDDAFFEELAETHTTQSQGLDHSSLYFSLAVFVLGNEGGIKVATLTPGNPEPARVRALPDGIDYETHIEQPFQEETMGSWYDQTIVVRCVRM